QPGSHRVGQATIDVVVGDATDPPVDPADYDLVFSNSVIEHVGGSDAIGAFADVTRRGTRYFLQTPNRWFLVEPHFVLPFHFLLPRRLKAAIVMWWDRGPRRRTYRQALERVDSIHLLTRRELEERRRPAARHRLRAHPGCPRPDPVPALRHGDAHRPQHPRPGQAERAHGRYDVGGRIVPGPRSLEHPRRPVPSRSRCLARCPI